jgi:hypothetical protein
MTSTSALVYLARGRDAGIEAARVFCESLDHARKGTAARPLYVLAKGWDDDPQGRRSLQEQFAGSTLLDLPDDGFDLGAYFRALPTIAEDRLLVFNSFSRIDHPDCIDILLQRLEFPGVGLVGCTASWGSLRPSFRQNLAVARVIAAASGARAGVQHFIRKMVDYPVEARDTRHAFPPFPNPHLRTNAFAIRRDLLHAFAAQSPIPSTKAEACALESGWGGLTRFVQARGFGVEVLSATGVPFGPDLFLESRTFRAGPGTRTLVAYNATRAYGAFSVTKKRLKEISAWGRALS